MLKIKTPKDILKFMDNIEYGYIDLLGVKHVNNLKGFRTNYRTLSIEQVLKYKIGTCIEQVLLMHKLLDDLNVPNNVREFMNQEKLMQIKMNICTVFYYIMIMMEYIK